MRKCNAEEQNPEGPKRGLHDARHRWQQRRARFLLPFSATFCHCQNQLLQRLTFLMFMRLPCGHFSSLCCSGSILLETVTKCRVYAQTVSMKYLAEMESPDAFTVLSYTGTFAAAFIHAERV
jgi:hypothetical protein